MKINNIIENIPTPSDNSRSSQVMKSLNTTFKTKPGTKLADKTTAQKSDLLKRLKAFLGFEGIDENANIIRAADQDFKSGKKAPDQALSDILSALEKMPNFKNLPQNMEKLVDMLLPMLNALEGMPLTPADKLELQNTIKELEKYKAGKQQSQPQPGTSI